MPRVPRSLQLVLLAGVAMGCGDPASTTPPGVPGVYLTGVVRNPDGSPVPRIMVVWEVWPAPDSVQEGAVSDFSVSWFMRTDSEGRFAAHVGYYSNPVLDSIEIATGEQDCWGLAPLSLRERAIALSPGTPDTVLDVALTPSQAAPRARLAIGAACTPMVGPPPFEEEDRLALWIDEIGDSVRGRWLTNYQATRGDDHGRFSGAREGALLRLDLRHDEPWDAGPSWGICTGYTVEVPIGPGDTLGVGTLDSDGCPFTPAPLRFVEGQPFAWPFP